MNKALRFLIPLALAFANDARAQSYGLTSRPAVGPYFDNVFPPATPTLGSWSTVNAYPNLTFINPMGILQVPGQSKMFVFEREGRAYIFDKAGTTATKTLALDISNQCQGWDDSGLMNLVFHPQFDLSGAVGTNRYIYVFYEWVPPGTVVGNPTTRPSNIIPAMRDRISRFELNASGVALAGSEVIIMDQAAANTWHNGSGMFFHPVNGFLYWTDGEDATGSNAQLINGKLLGGVFRVDVDKRGGNISHAPVRVPVGVTTQNYFIPNSNPFVGQAGVNEEFFALGLRSPHRMTYDPPSGRIFISDVGSGSREEINVMEPNESGNNYQWEVIEGYGADLTPPCTGVNKRPVLDYPRDDGQAVIGGYVYRGSALPQLYGKYLFADNATGNVWALNEGTTPATKTLLTTVPNATGPNSGTNYTGISSWGVDGDNEIYLTQLSSTAGKILKLQAGGATSTTLPATLSATGLFSDVANLVPSARLIPYTLNAPFWSDKAIKSRWFTVPTGGSIGFGATGDWNFPAGSIAVKHFELGTDDTNAAVRKRLETRVIVKTAGGGVYGATYKWRADNSDADLLSEALTETVPIAIPSVGNFSGANIGNPGVAGSTTRNGNTLTVIGGGADIGGTSDQFYFAHQQRTGNFDISMKATSLTQPNLYTKLGLMARASLTANSPHYFTFVWPNNAARGANNGGYEIHCRTTAGGNTTAIHPAAPQDLVAYPTAWIRLERTGNTFISYSSSDGVNWREHGRNTQSLPATVYFGVALTSHDNALSATGTIELQTTRLQPWYYPGRTDCVTCHTSNAGGFLGPKTRQLNKDFTYPSTGVTDNQLRALNHVGMFNTALNEAGIPGFDKLAHVDQAGETLEKRARSYVDTNCANCHRPGGVPALWDARYDTPLASQGIIFGTVNSPLGLVNPQVVVPQATGRSMLHHRIDRIGANQMPPLARNMVDEAGVQLIADWINSLPANPPPAVALTAPADGASVYLPDLLTMTVTATDGDGIARVEFYDGGTKVGQTTTAPYTFTLASPALGPHTLFARAYDGVNNAADSASVTVAVKEWVGLVNAKINFQPAASAVPADYLPDTGATYSARGNGLTYGWSRDNTADSRARGVNPDARYDTLIHMQKDHGGGSVTSTWSIALPNSRYSVHVVAGDASATDSIQAVSANGVVLTTGQPAAQNFYEGTANVTVTNGLLTLAPGGGAVNAKICFVDISEIAPTGGNQLPVVSISGTLPEFVAAGGSAKILATASDPDGSVTRVEFYADGVKVGEDFTAPYSYVWSGIPAGAYSITARAIDNAGSGARSGVAKLFAFGANQTGLYAQYWNNIDFTAYALGRLDATVNFDYGFGSPDPSVGVETFSARWRGRVLARNVGTYTLKVISDDGVRMWVNGVQLVNAWIGQGATPYSGTATFAAESLNDIQVDYFEGGGVGSIQLLWSGPGFTEEVIPAANLLTPIAGTPSSILSGTIIGTAGSSNNDPATTKAAAFDGNLATYFDSPNSNGDWAGLDLGSGLGRRIVKVRYCPRIGFAGRMPGGVFQGANAANFSDAVTLFAIAATPPEGLLTEQAIGNTTVFRYLRYLSPINGFCNVAEVEFHAVDTPPSTPTGLTATAGNLQVGLAWSAAANAANYNIKRGTASGGPFLGIANTAAVGFTDTTAANNTTYYYVVTAVNDGGESANSNQSSATPVSPPIAAWEKAAPRVSMSGNNFVIGVNATIHGHTYQLQYSDTLAPTDWHDLGAPVSGSGPGVDFLIAKDTAGPRRFYRILVSQ